MQRAEFDAFTQQLRANLEKDPRVLGLVALGSMADTSRVDRWSDHDFFVITQAGIQEEFRTNVTWLPQPERIVLNIRETAHGLKVIYDDGHLLEFAVFDVEELAVARINAFTVLIDHERIAERCGWLQHNSVPTTPRDLQRDYEMFLALLMVGAGRCARGEVISGGVFVKTYALGHLLPVLAEYLSSADKARLDNLDVYRRFEWVFPEVGAAINNALLLEPVTAARRLLGIADEQLRHKLPHYPSNGVETVHRYLSAVT